jgi:hypothetical protein
MAEGPPGAVALESLGGLHRLKSEVLRVEHEIWRLPVETCEAEFF